MRALSLFANVGLGEYYLDSIGVNVVVANELLEDRVEFYKQIHPNTKHVICGDICSQGVQNKIVKACEKEGGIDLIIATPPCQGMSIANAQKESDDIRNKLIVHAMNVFNRLKPKYMLIENVPGMARTYINYRRKPWTIYDFIKSKIPEDFECIPDVLNGKDFGSPQSRARSICLISQNGEWVHPKPHDKVISLREAIGDDNEFCSLESNMHSTIPWHFASKNNSNHIDWMRHTPTGKSAYFNYGDHYPSQEVCNPSGSNETKIEYIKKTNGESGWHTNPPILIAEDGSSKEAPFTNENVNGKDVLKVEIPEGFTLKREIYGFTTTYKRMNWNDPAPTVTMTNGSISSQNNVHPGHKNKDGTYSDARVLSVREILAVCGLPTDMLDKFAHPQSDGTFKYDYTHNFIRKVLGELFLPLMCKEIVATIPNKNNKPVETPQLEFNFDYAIK